MMTQNKTIASSRRFTSLVAAFTAGGAGIALISGAACNSTAATAKTDLLLGSSPMQVAARQGGGGAAEGTVKAGVASLADDAKIAKITTKILEQSHYERKPIDNSLSPKVFDAFLDTLDPQRVFFLQSDIDDFSARYRENIVGLTADKGDFSPAQTMYARMLERAKEQTDYATALLKDSSNFTFTGNDTFPVDRKDATRPASEEQAKALWKDRVRYEYLQEKLGNEKPDAIVTKLTNRYARTLRTLKEYDSDDLFELYMNTVTHVLDPHTDYFGKASAETFNIQMKLSLYGIGATLREEDGYTVIEDIKPGSPAQKSKKLKAGDKIVGVAQGADGNFTDVVEMKLNRVVEQIRGPKGSTVRLKVIPADASDPSTREEVVLVRDEIKLEESAAKARLIESPQANGKTLRLGVIDLPLFYQDSDKGKSCTKDVALLLDKLKEEKVDGVILDLRRNGGGSLPEAISLTGLFIKNGPVVQVRDTRGIKVDEDTDPSVTYSGPLVVLTSRQSASASEIVTGALQDYGRAVVVGDQSSFGKGTVQALVNLGPIMDQANAAVQDDPGQLKLTIQKFYRASGSSTQLKGVIPDVILPSLNDALKIGEKDLDNPMPWDTIPSAKYTKLNLVSPVAPELVKRSAARVASDPDFAYLKGSIALVAKAQDRKSISLNEVARKKEQDEMDARTAARQKVLAARPAPADKVYVISLKDAVKPGLPKALTPVQLKNNTSDSDEDFDDTPSPATTKNSKDKPRIAEPDVILNEAEHVMADYISLTNAKNPAVAARH